MGLIEEYLGPRGVTDPDVMAARGYRETEDGIMIPLYTVNSASGDGEPYGHEIRLIPPKMTMVNGKVREQKFSRPKGQDQQLSINPMYWERPADGKPLWLVEGTSRADALHQRGVNSVVSLTSCWGWKNGRTGVDPQLDELALRGKEVWIWFDGDVLSNPKVNLAAHRLSAVLESRGALIKFGLVPDQMGLDDYLAQGHDVTALRMLLVDDLPLADDAAVTEDRFTEGTELPRTSDAALARAWISETTEVCHIGGLWYAHVQGKWQLTPGGTAARTRLLPYMERIGLGYQEYGDDSGSSKARAFGRKTREVLESSAKCASVLQQGLALPEAARQPDDFDRDPWLLNLANGTLHLKTREFHEHRAEDMLTHIAPALYDQNATAPVFQTFLAASLPDPEVQAYVRRMLGATLVGMTLSQRVLVFSGRTRAGKGTLIRALFHMMGRDLAGELRREVIMKTGRGGADHQTQVMWLKGRRLVSVNETNDGEEFDAAKLKMLSGGDEITARGMHQDQQTFKPTHNMILSTNSLPNVDSSDLALWGRLRVIPFRESFLGREDETLDHRLQAEAPGILNWLLAGLREYLDIGEGPLPRDVSRAKQEWRDTGDSVSGFADAQLQGPRPKGGSIARGDFRVMYEKWCEQNDMPPVGPTSGKFKAGLEAKGFRELQVPRELDSKRPRHWAHPDAWGEVGSSAGELDQSAPKVENSNAWHWSLPFGTGTGAGVELGLTCMELDELEQTGGSYQSHSSTRPSFATVWALLTQGDVPSEPRTNSGSSSSSQVSSGSSSSAKIVCSGSTPAPGVISPDAPI